jgi:hypothetical protein
MTVRELADFLENILIGNKHLENYKIHLVVENVDGGTIRNIYNNDGYEITDFYTNKTEDDYTNIQERLYLTTGPL